MELFLQIRILSERLRVEVPGLGADFAPFPLDLDFDLVITAVPLFVDIIA